MNSFKWLATILFLSAGLLISLNIEISRFGFICFLAGHIILSLVFFKNRDYPMIVQNLAFIVIDVIGIYKWFF